MFEHPDHSKKEKHRVITSSTPMQTDCNSCLSRHRAQPSGPMSRLQDVNVCTNPTRALLIASSCALDPRMGLIVCYGH